MLVNILIVFFVLLIAYQLMEMYVSCNKEGLTNNDTSKPVYIPFQKTPQSTAIANAEIQQYAGNIEYLKMEVDNLEGLKDTVKTMQTNIDSLQKQVDGLVQQQATFAQKLVGTTPPAITGTEPDTVENVANSIESTTK